MEQRSFLFVLYVVPTTPTAVFFADGGRAFLLKEESKERSSGDEIPDDLTMAENMQMYINVSKKSKFDPEKTKRIMAEV